LRAAVLGANDGAISVSSLIVGVAAAKSSQQEILLAGLAGLIAGALSMAAGEYVSVSSQSDLELADLARERRELDDWPEEELQELAELLQRRGLPSELAREVAEHFSAHDALHAHALEELQITPGQTARPVEAALSSASSFVAGAILPLALVLLIPGTWLIGSVMLATLAVLACLGGLAAMLGGASIPRGVVRVVVWGALAMALTAGIGSLFGVKGEL
jgi:VIT1/CCC1 family predicted Fe2+/Mn2+ transporter